MGFKNGAVCTVFDVRPVSEKVTKLRIAISRKVPGSDPARYEQDFGGFISVLGAQAAKQASKLRIKDRITLGETDVSLTYDKDKGKEYTDFKVFGFTKTEKTGDKGASKPGNKAEDPQTEEGDGDYPF